MLVGMILVFGFKMLILYLFCVECIGYFVIDMDVVVKFVCEYGVDVIVDMFFDLIGCDVIIVWVGDVKM